MHSQLLVLSGLLFGLVLIHLANGADIPVGDCGSNNHLNALGPGDRFVIQSHDFSQPGGYDGPQRCVHVFRKPGRCSAISITCDQFELEPPNSNGKCKRDFVNVKGSGLSSSFNNKRFCGSYSSISLTAPTKKIRFFFKTNSRKNNFDGFQCYVSCADDLPSTTAPPPTTTSAPGSCQCGVPNRQNRIVGGEDTEPNEYPWQAYVFVEDRNDPGFGISCGGSLISDRHVLSAAHCFPNSLVDFANTSNVLVIMGVHDFTNFQQTQTEFRNAKSVTMHPQYDDITTDNDFAVIELDSPISFSAAPNIRPVCLPSSGSNLPTGADVTATGWGTTSFQGSSANILQEVTVPTVSSSNCQQNLANVGITITSNMLCAGLAAGGKDSCQGDSGGPLVSNHFTNNFYELYGVTSFGYGCALPNKPGIYAKVTAALGWIMPQIGTPPCARPSNRNVFNSSGL